MVWTWLVAVAPAWAHTPVIWTVDAGDPDWCDVIAGAAGGDEVLFAPGRFVGPCVVELPPAYNDNEQTVIGSLDPLDPAVLVAPAGQAALEVSGARLVLGMLVFEGAGAGADGLRLMGLTEAWVRETTFRDLDGTAVVAEGVADMHVTQSSFEGVGGALVLGAPDGSAPVPAIETLWNLGSDVGVAVRAYPGTAGILADDTWVGVREVGLDLAGGGAGNLVVERQLVEGTDGVRLTNGPVWLTSSVVLASGVAVHGGDASATDISLLGNTLVGATDLSGWGPGRGLRAISNAADEALPETGAELGGNVACAGEPCFTDLASWDVFPGPDSPLRGAAQSLPELSLDWCARRRVTPGAAGAIEVIGESFGPLPTVMRWFVPCGDVGTTATTPPATGPDTGDTAGTPADDDDPKVQVRPEEPGGCACESGAGLWPLFGVSLKRRRA